MVAFALAGTLKSIIIHTIFGISFKRKGYFQLSRCQSACEKSNIYPCIWLDQQCQPNALHIPGQHMITSNGIFATNARKSCMLNYVNPM